MYFFLTLYSLFVTCSFYLATYQEHLSLMSLITTPWTFTVGLHLDALNRLPVVGHVSFRFHGMLSDTSLKIIAYISLCTWGL